MHTITADCYLRTCLKSFLTGIRSAADILWSAFSSQNPSPSAGIRCPMFLSNRILGISTETGKGPSDGFWSMHSAQSGWPLISYPPSPTCPTWKGGLASHHRIHLAGFNSLVWACGRGAWQPKAGLCLWAFNNLLLAPCPECEKYGRLRIKETKPIHLSRFNSEEREQMLKQSPWLDAGCSTSTLAECSCSSTGKIGLGPRHADEEPHNSL